MKNLPKMKDKKMMSRQATDLSGFKNLTGYRYILLSYFLTCLTFFSCGSRSQRQPEQPVKEDSQYVQIVPEGWESLMDGKTLDGWEAVQYGGEGEPYVKDGVLTLPMATDGFSTGVCWIGDLLPVNNYAVYYEARRMAGHDIFGALSFPYGDTFATLIVGGWSGLVCGLSSIDGRDASENETTKYIHLKDKQWYPVQLRVTIDSIRAVIDTVQVVDIATAGKRIHLRGGTQASSFTLSTYLTTGEIRNLRIKKLP
jgi:hypothetical protein